MTLSFRQHIAKYAVANQSGNLGPIRESDSTELPEAVPILSQIYDIILSDVALHLQVH